MKENLKKAIHKGLSKPNKTLPSKYFYDAVGDKIFVKIMHMPEYYLTRAELEIFKHKADEIVSFLNVNKNQHFEIIELGAGDGTKTKLLLKPKIFLLS